MISNTYYFIFFFDFLLDHHLNGIFGNLDQEDSPGHRFSIIQQDCQMCDL